MADGDVEDEFGIPVTPERPYQGHIRVYYYRDLEVEDPHPLRRSDPAPGRAPHRRRQTALPARHPVRQIPAGNRAGAAETQARLRRFGAHPPH